MRRQRVTIGPRILEHYKFLRQIAKSKVANKRIQYLKNATKDQLLALVEIASNILSPNFKLTKRNIDRLTPHAAYIRRLSRVRSERAARKLTQFGNGFALPALLIPIIAEVGRFILSNRNGE
jgi:hypothetical protein